MNRILLPIAIAVVVAVVAVNLDANAILSSLQAGLRMPVPRLALLAQLIETAVVMTFLPLIALLLWGRK